MDAASRPSDDTCVDNAVPKDPSQHSGSTQPHSEVDELDSDADHARRFIECFVVVPTSAKPWGEPPDERTLHAPAFRHLHHTLQRVEQGDAAAKKQCAALIRQYRMWRDNLNPLQPDFVALKKLATHRLRAMADKWESEVYAVQGIAETLGQLAGPTRPGSQRRPRQDDYVPMPDWDWVANDFRAEWSLVVVLLLLAHTVDPLFQQSVAACVAPHGAHRDPGVKNSNRMRNKLYGDFRLAMQQEGVEPPLSSLNVDINRCACTFDSQEHLAGAFDDLQHSVGEAIRVKNTFAPEYDARTKSFGYRCVLMNILFEPTVQHLADVFSDAPAVQQYLSTKPQRKLVWGDVIDLPAAKARWEKWYSTQETGTEELYVAATSYIREKLRDVPLKFVCEVQLCLRPYLDMRKKSHFWYKIVRADKPRALCYDFLSSYKKPIPPIPAAAAGGSRSEQPPSSSDNAAVADATTDASRLDEDIMEEGVDIPFA